MRPAVAADLPAIVALLADARARAAGMRGGPQLLSGTGWGPQGGLGVDPGGDVGPWIARAGDRLLLAGLLDGVVVGVAAGHVVTAGHGPVAGDAAGVDAPPGPATGPIGVVDCCYVEPGARQVGVGGALAEALVEWFDSLRCAGIDVAALPGDRATKQLWEAAGFSARLLVLHRRRR